MACNEERAKQFVIQKQQDEQLKKNEQYRVKQEQEAQLNAHKNKPTNNQASNSIPFCGGIYLTASTPPSSYQLKNGDCAERVGYINCERTLNGLLSCANK